MENYRKVYCKDRLPNDNERYDTNIGTLRFYPKEKKGQQWKDGFLDAYYHPRYWYESTPTQDPPAAGPTIQGKGEEVKGVTDEDIDKLIQRINLDQANVDFIVHKNHGQINGSLLLDLRKFARQVLSLLQPTNAKGVTVSVSDLKAKLYLSGCGDYLSYNKQVQHCAQVAEQFKKHLPSLLQPTPGQGEWTQANLRKLVDIAWNECTESNEVPSTDWADRIIAKAANKKGE